MTPTPGKPCPCCGRKVRRVTERMDAAYRRVAASPRAQRVIDMLAAVGPLGMTDDRIDVRTQWGHQNTTPIMRALRYVGAVGWQIGADGEYLTATTRRGVPARINVLAEYLSGKRRKGAA